MLYPQRTARNARANPVFGLGIGLGAGGQGGAALSNINQWNQKVFDVRVQYGVQANAIRFTDGNCNISSPNTINSAGQVTWTSADIGKVIMLNGAGIVQNAVRVPYVGTITAVSGNSCTVTPALVGNVASGGIGWYGTDDTTAWNNAFADMGVRGGGGLFCVGASMVNGPMQSTNSGFAQIMLPNSTYAGPKIVIDLFGPYSDGWFPTEGEVASQFGGFTMISTFINFVTDNTTPSLIGGATSNLATFTLFSNVFIRVENVTFMAPSNPTLTMLDFSAVQGCAVRKCRFITTDGMGSGLTALPTSYKGVGLQMPYVNNNDRAFLDECVAHGFYCGFVLGEHTAGNNLGVYQCVLGFGYLNGGGGHAVWLGYASCESTNYALSGFANTAGGGGGVITLSSGGPIPIIIEMLDLEDAISGAFAKTAHVNDPNSFFTGRICYAHGVSGTGIMSGITTNGCNVLSFQDITRPFTGALAPTRLTASVTNATATMANLADLTQTLGAGLKYTGRLVIKCNNSTAAEGIQVDFNGGTATMTSFFATAFVAVSSGTDTAGTVISTSLAGVINWTTITGETVIEILISFVVNATGTFIPRAAENSHATGTLTAELGSYLTLQESAN